MDLVATAQPRQKGLAVAEWPLVARSGPSIRFRFPLSGAKQAQFARSEYFTFLTQTGRRSPAFLDSAQTRDSFVLDRGLFDSALAGGDDERELTREP
jgi:hypothetical protein